MSLGRQESPTVAKSLIAHHVCAKSVLAAKRLCAAILCCNYCAHNVCAKRFKDSFASASRVCVSCGCVRPECVCVYHRSRSAKRAL